MKNKPVASWRQMNTEKKIRNKALDNKRDLSNLELVRKASAMLCLIALIFFVQNIIFPGLPVKHPFYPIYNTLFVFMFIISFSVYSLLSFYNRLFSMKSIHNVILTYIFLYSIWMALLAGMDYKVGDQASFYGLGILTIPILYRAGLSFYVAVYTVSISSFSVFFLILPGRAEMINFFFIFVYLLIGIFFAKVMNTYFDNSVSLQGELKKKNEELQQLTTAVEQSSASIVISDTSGGIIYTNPAESGKNLNLN